MEEIRGNPQNRTDWRVRTVSYRKQVGVVHRKESMHCSCCEVQPRGSYNQSAASRMLTLRSSSLLPAWVRSHLRHLVGCIVSRSALGLEGDHTSLECRSEQHTLFTTCFGSCSQDSLNSH